MKFKSYAEIKDVDLTKRRVKAVWSTMGVKDFDGDIIHAGAFDKTIVERGPKGINQIKHFKNHDIYKAPAVVEELYVENNQLIEVGKYLDTTLGNDTLTEIQEGQITEHSIGFSIPKDKAEFKEDTFHIYEVKLFEGSALNGWGANMFTPVLEVNKGLDKDFLEKLSKQIERVEKTLSIGNLSDERYIELNVEYQRLLTYIKTLLKEEPQDQGKEVLELIKSTLLPKEPSGKELIEILNKTLKK